MTVPIRVFVNEQPVDIDRGATAVGAVRLLDPALADAVVAGVARLTDARGIGLAPDTPLAAGDILRAVHIARRAASDADA